MDNSNASSVNLHNPLRWIPEFLQLSRRRLRTQARLLASAAIVGIIAGLGAVLFYSACQVVTHYALDAFVGYRPNHPSGERELFAETDTPFNPWLLLLVPTVGGLMSGALVYTLAPEAEGHGTDAAIDAYHHRQGRMRPRIPLVKIVASALTIGSGGSGGREGPIAQIGAGFGSFLGGLLRLGPSERRILMAAGMGAGVAAIFRAPLAGALFAAEVLYQSPEFESEVIIPAGLASVLAYCTYGWAFGWKPLFSLSPALLAQLTFDDPRSLALYLVLALFMVLLAMLYTRSFYGLTHWFHRLPVKPHVKPALGAFLAAVTGLILYAVFGRDTRVLAVLSFGYGSLETALSHETTVTAALLLAIALGKILTTGLTIGSGGSGGVFGPSMVIGGCGGGALGILFQNLFPAIAPHPASFVLVGMAGFFAAAAKTPFSTLIIVSEMTGNYNLLLPSLWVCSLSFLLSDKQSIYQSQVKSKSLSPAHQGDYVRAVLAEVRVGPLVVPAAEVPTVRPGDSLAKVMERLGTVAHSVLPVLDGDGRLVGVVNLEEIHLASRSPHLGQLVLAADLMRGDIAPLRADDRLDYAVEQFVENDLDALPVVADLADRRVIGMVRRADVTSTYLRYVHGVAETAITSGNL
jgi:CIC family chloride channel protein